MRPTDVSGKTLELLRPLITNGCVNDGSADTIGELRNAATIAAFLDGVGLDVEVFEPAPRRASLVTRIEGRDPTAAKLCLLGHTDVVPVDPSGWERDPFGAEVVNGELWGRGSLDMLNLTASMAVVIGDLAAAGFRPRGDLIFAAVADEEAGSQWGAQWLVDQHWDLVGCDYVVTEGGGIHGGKPRQRTISFNVAEKGVSWRRLTIRGEPGHGSMPFRRDNALVTAAEVVRRLAAYQPSPRIHQLWADQLRTLDLDPTQIDALLDPATIDETLAALPDAGLARHLHACSHTTVSPNAVGGYFKTNTIPSAVTIDVDIRTLPGETARSVGDHLRAALGPLADAVEVGVLLDSEPTTSSTATPLWASIERSVHRQFPQATPTPMLHMGFTDARCFRQRGAVAYGTGLFSEDLAAGEFASRFHGHNERIDLASLGLTTTFFADLVTDFMS